MTRTSTNARWGSVITGVVVTLLLMGVFAPPRASAHPDPLDTEGEAEGLGVEVLSGPEGLAGFLSAHQWAGTPTITDEGTDAFELAYVAGGCTPLSYAGVDVEGKIALVDQAAAGGANPCVPSTFFQKVQYAQQAGAVGFLQVPTLQANSNATAIQADIPALDLIRVTEIDDKGTETKDDDTEFAKSDDAAALLRDAVKRGETVTVRFIDRRPVFPSTSNQLCENGFAGDTPFRCDGVDLLGFVSHKEFNSAGISDIWGWTDPGEDGEPGNDDTYEDDEYVIMGKTNGVAFFRVTDPAAPEYLGELPNPGLVQAVWHDIKVFDNHAFIVSESEGHGMTVFDLTRLRDVDDVRGEEGVEPWTSDARYRMTSAAHNLEINEEIGMAYILGGNAGIVAPDQCLSGLHMVDINDPTSPTFRGCYVLEGGPGTAARTVGSPATDVSPAAYVHDAQCVVYRGPDEEHRGKDICVTAAENKIVVADVSNPAVPLTLGTSDYEHVGYTHQGWFDETQTFWFVNDELAQMTFPDEAPNTRTIVMDLTDLDDPKPSFDYHPPNPVSDTGGMKAITHNNYVVGDLLYQSNYASGLRVADISRVAEGEMTEVAWFDTYPTDDATNFDGTWSNYPFFASGTIAVSGRNEGLFLLALAEDATPAVDLSCTDCPVEIRAGETGDASLAVANTGDVDDRYDLTVAGLPDGWTATASPDPASVPAGGVGNATLTIEVPRQARQGTYTFTVTATSGVDASVSDTADVVVEVVKGKPSQAGPPDDSRPTGTDGQVRSAGSGSTTAVLAAAPSGPSTPPIALGIAMLVLTAGVGSSVVRRRSTR